MIVRWFYGELVVLDLSETGTQLGEKLSLLLDDKQQKELAHYLLGDMVSTIGTRKNLSNNHLSFSENMILFVLS